MTGFPLELFARPGQIPAGDEKNDGNGDIKQVHHIRILSFSSPE
jgi:hypothetical protein